MSFESDIAAFVAKTKKNTDTVIRNVALELHKQIIQNTPVDYGIARANWAADIGYPSTFMYNPRTPKKSEGQANLRGEAKRVEADNEIMFHGKLKLMTGNVLYITNSLPYIKKLEFGHSEQSPQGMVRTAVANVRTNLQEAVRGLK